MRMCSGRRLPATRRKNGPRLPERQSASFNLPFITKGRLCGFFYGIFLCRCTQPPSCWRQMRKFKFDPLFLRLFFRESYPFTTEKVYLSQIPGLVNMALYVSPIVSGEVIRSRGGSTSEFTPGYVKPKHE
ncbi:hypothetical protein AWF80_013165 [Escherichia coli]|nr:hypothetical protein AWF80_013165 [Escherichia coli]TRY39722.1 hypothetical protein FNJ78_00515 [Escherichia coli]